MRTIKYTAYHVVVVAVVLLATVGVAKLRQEAARRRSASTVVYMYMMHVTVLAGGLLTMWSIIRRDVRNSVPTANGDVTAPIEPSTPAKTPNQANWAYLLAALSVISNCLLLPGIVLAVLSDAKATRAARLARGTTCDAAIRAHLGGALWAAHIAMFIAVGVVVSVIVALTGIASE